MFLCSLYHKIFTIDTYIIDICSISRGYEMPTSPNPGRLEAASRQFFWGIQKHLLSKSISPIYVNIDLDIWRYITHGKGKESDHKGFWLYSIEDMSRMQLPETWWYILNTHGEVHAIKPPLKIKQVLKWTPKHQILENSKLTPGLQMPIEKICIDFVKRPCNIKNIYPN